MDYDPLSSRFSLLIQLRSPVKSKFHVLWFTVGLVILACHLDSLASSRGLQQKINKCVSEPGCATYKNRPGAGGGMGWGWGGFGGLQSPHFYNPRVIFIAIYSSLNIIFRSMTHTLEHENTASCVWSVWTKQSLGLIWFGLVYRKYSSEQNAILVWWTPCNEV